MPEMPSRLATALADRYRIERELGAGGMATVYLAGDPRHHGEVAIEVLKPEPSASDGSGRPPSPLAKSWHRETGRPIFPGRPGEPRSRGKGAKA
jgi:serine/threonine protein kinase